MFGCVSYFIVCLLGSTIGDTIIDATTLRDVNIIVHMACAQVTHMIQHGNVPAEQMVEAMHQLLDSCRSLYGVAKNVSLLEGKWSLVCRSYLGWWLRVQSLTAFWRQKWRQKTMPDMASGFPSTDCSVPCLAPFFDAMSGLKKLTKVHAVSDYHTLACHPSVGGKLGQSSAARYAKVRTILVAAVRVCRSWVSDCR